jgi:8-oxo-dGTP pyrophosphatase MutT (NUDIX family)
MTATKKCLYSNPWVSLYEAADPERGVPGFVFSHETRCEGRIVAVLPYVVSGWQVRVLMHSENNPAWGWGPNLASVTGGQESDDPAEDAAREVREETGYQVTKSHLVSLGTCRGTKSVDTVYSLFAVNLDGVMQGEVDADSVLEASEHPEWVSWDEAAASVDPLVSVMMLRAQSLVFVSMEEGRTRPDREPLTGLGFSSNTL